MDGRRNRFDRLDRGLGCLLWKPLTFIFVLAAAGGAWMAVNALRELEGSERLIGFALGLVTALVFGAGAFRVARKRGISEIDV